MKTVQLIAMLLFLALPGCDAIRAEQKRAPILGATKTQNVLLVTTDGMRWQEVFGGADAGAHEHGARRSGRCRFS